MNALQNDTHIDAFCVSNRTEESAQASLAKRSLQLLSPQEIGAVAGGPESEVGNGITPPH